MSSIPYNYGSYIDAKVSMTNSGTVDSGKQIQSPASAGSRGLAKTTQFTNDKTQMQLGQEAIAESMTEIRSILNRIDGVNAPVREDAGEDEKVVDMLRKIKQHLDNHPNMNEHPSLVALDQLADDLESGDKPADYESAVEEDAGEGHMSKSQLYQTAKMAIELLDMINKGDDLEGWVRTKLNLAADYLQAVYHYEDYQKLNPYREELDGSLIQRHAGIIQKNLDEILERKCRAEDVDTKPGMMRILAKRVNEVEKEIAKENRKKTKVSGFI